jgi:exopolysaccharide biosynthesis polyprenyl glycosylphosphotransferase
METGMRPASDDAEAGPQELNKLVEHSTGPDHLTVVRSVGDLKTVTELDSDLRLGLPDNGRPRPKGAPGGVRVRYRAIGLILAGSDILCLALAVVLSQMLSVGMFGRVPLPLPAVLGVSALWVVVFHAFGLYLPQHLSSHEAFRRVISATSVGMVLVVAVTFGSTPALSRTWIGLTWFLALVFELASRRLWSWWTFTMKADGRLSYRTLIVGDNDEALRLSDALGEEGLGYSAIGLISVKPHSNANGVRPLGHVDRLGEIIEKNRAECVFVASSSVDLEQMTNIHRVARRMGVELRVSANMPEILTSRLSVKPVGGLMAISFRPVHLSGTQAALKRTFDILVSAIALIVAFPVLVFIAAAIKLTSRGPVLFKQDRITSGGRTFTMFKFRTMIDDANRLMDENNVDRSQAFFKLDSPVAITRVGRWLRRLSLDELPQLWNILRGEMSVVGPRPLPAEQVMANLDLLEPRHEVRAGLTGWWQINGRSDIDPEASVRMDMFYIENWSLSLDLYILLKTIGAVLVRRGAY